MINSVQCSALPDRVAGCDSEHWWRLQSVVVAGGRWVVLLAGGCLRRIFSFASVVVRVTALSIDLSI
jgi:hypothetical protein